MYRYRLKSPIQNQHRHKTLDKTWLKHWGITLCLSLLVACGFVYVSWQHVQAVQIGYETEQIKQQIQNLDQEQRKLQLERQRQLAPHVLETRARQQGFELPTSQQTVAIQTR